MSCPVCITNRVCISAEKIINIYRQLRWLAYISVCFINLSTLDSHRALHNQLPPCFRTTVSRHSEFTVAKWLTDTGVVDLRWVCKSLQWLEVFWLIVLRYWIWSTVWAWSINSKELSCVFQRACCFLLHNGWTLVLTNQWVTSVGCDHFVDVSWYLDVISLDTFIRASCPSHSVKYLQRMCSCECSESRYVNMECLLVS